MRRGEAIGPNRRAIVSRGARTRASMSMGDAGADRWGSLRSLQPTRPESTAALGAHIGHKVAITGLTVAGQEPKVHTMNVTAMKHLDVTCP